MALLSVSTGSLWDLVVSRKVQTFFIPQKKSPKDKHAPTSPPVWLDVGLEAGSVLAHVSQSTIHTMALSAMAWGQTGLRDAERIIFNHYVICNDTHEALRLGQVCLFGFQSLQMQ